MFPIKSYGNYSSFGIFNKWNECYSIGCNTYWFNILIDVITIVMLFIVGCMFYRKIKSKLKQKG